MFHQRSLNFKVHLFDSFNKVLLIITLRQKNRVYVQWTYNKLHGRQISQELKSKNFFLIITQRVKEQRTFPPPQYKKPKLILLA